MPPRLSAQDFDPTLPAFLEARMHRSLDRRSFLVGAQKLALMAGLLATLGPGLAFGQPAAPATPAARPARLRGNLTAVSANSVTLRTRAGETVELALAANLVVNEVYPIALADVKAGSFIGVGAMPQADGSQRAIALTVFPESARGTGEGHYPFDLAPQSTMTNATVADVAAAPEGRKLQVRYKDGEKTIVVPPDAPVVTFKPGDRSLLVTGASVSLTAQEVDGKPTALRINAGRNGFALPY